ncbi:NAD(P)/FAD-dependent oxidoreductase [Bradyrhizobium viridifuturi]|jgi:phytoene dehydrogenase-like protein|uniref:phytoene desaturase family protein n=1 Tax=Bradyrhizobium TaxID=374 RepID=UPI0003971527|nr:MULTISPECIES: NAD(P)/FAD-dependent oxidoreductase [Bradyrhizobium]ERF83379.1 MAG: K(+)-stimulated pyrophosphate-energized sodium pump [Bradyrhizobium sp. DFCI-1]OYU60294.1 MAG: NAD(P)/FAD-dependent oxidoreductase [Bradyrhizobium sp. PARBB1]PSO23762.1 NAD(P)/FAD-dependent oxidoreductase [Bradyrhizobium sp. MOS004]QRI68080.1 NAD(P)/FAD-dependent oxidoreductase [Bradyrhizobium sp. PSBB068]MBR1023018.1 NAD(P)/FAD-dependent oxidoreductase [Bradyrhizobium viridifuturi]
MNKTDVVIIGAGHNGLTCAAYLAMAGLRVKVVERRKVVGGAAVTEEFCPGFRNSVAAYTVSLLNPQIISDLKLADHGLRIVERRAQNFLPAPDGSHLLTGEGRTQQSVAKLSPHDAAAIGAFSGELEAIADVLRQFVLRAPPNLVEGFGIGAISEVFNALGTANILRRLSLEQQRNLLDLFTRSAGEMLDERFDNDLVKALFGFDAIVGNYASPYAAGSAYVMLHHAFGEVNGKKGVWGHAIGGMGAITQAMARAARSHGVEIETDAPVREVIVENDRATGVILDSGETVRAKYVVSNVNPKLLYTRLVPEGALAGEFRTRISRWQNGSGTFRMNVALSALPSFTALPGPGDHLTAGIIIAPSLGYMDRAWRDAREFGWSRAPVVELLIPSTLDDSLSPPGQHVASLFCQHVAPQLPGGKSWDDHRDEAADLMIATVDRYAPGFAGSVIGRQILSPLDLERQFGLLGGDIFHGALTLNQLFSARPMLGHADYRGPLRGLYHCGSGAHPGGGVTGAPGHNAARAILADHRALFA